MKTSYIALICLFIWVGHSQAQSASEFHYQASFPVGKFGDFVSKPGWLGFTGQWVKYLKNDRLALGGSLNYFYFSDKKGRRTEDFGTAGTYTGYVVNFTNIYGGMVVLQYDLKPRNDRMVPFLRVGAGTDYQDQRKDIGLYEFKGDGWQFMSNLEAGVRLNAGGNINWVIAATYHYMPKSGDLIETSFIGLKLGVHTFSF